MTEPVHFEVECGHGCSHAVMASDDQFALQCWVTWHIFTDHREIWLQVIGERYPDDPRPDLSKILVAG